MASERRMFTDLTIFFFSPDVAPLASRKSKTDAYTSARKSSLVVYNIIHINTDIFYDSLGRCRSFWES